jgi:PAS domain S-box-containing protein
MEHSAKDGSLFKFSSPEGLEFIAVLDLNGDRLYATRSNGRIPGLPLVPQNGDPFREVHPDDRDKIKNVIRKSIRTGVGKRVEYRVIMNDGSIRLFESQGSILWDEDRKPTKIVVVSRDITEKKRVEESLTRYAGIIESSSHAIIGMNLDGDITSWNVAAGKMFGYTVKEAVRHSISILAPPKVPDELPRLLARLRGGEKELSLETARFRKNGKPILVSMILSPVYDSAERVVGASLMAREITGGKKVGRKLLWSDLKFRSLVEQSLAGVYLIQGDKFVYVNPKMSEIFGYTQPEFKALASARELITEPESAREKRSNDQGARGVQYVARSQRKDGSAIDIEVYGTRTNYGGRPAIIGGVLDITDIKNAERSLRESEARFRSLVEATSDWIWEVDEQGVYTYASPKVKDVLGYVPDEVIGKKPADFMTPDEQTRSAIEMKRKMHSRLPIVGIESSNLHNDGHVIILETSAVPILDKRGRLHGYRGISRDITERKRTEKEVRMLAQALRSSNECVIITDRNDTILFVNDAFAKTYGYGRKEVIGKQIDMIRSATSHPHVKTIRDATLRGGWQGELVNRKKDGSEFPVYLSTSVVPDEHGEPYALISVAVDISRREEAEAQLRKLSRAVEQSPASIVITDTSGTIEYVNPKFTKLTGYTAGEAIGRNTRILKSGEMPHEDYKRLWETILSGNEWQGEFHNKKKNGELYWEFASISPVRNADGVVTHFVAVKEDVTYRKKVEEERAKLVVELQHALAKVKTLSGMLPICAWCKKVRDDEGYWKRIELYIEDIRIPNSPTGFVPNVPKSKDMPITSRTDKIQTQISGRPVEKHQPRPYKSGLMYVVDS